jgi:hypothetical protein
VMIGGQDELVMKCMYYELGGSRQERRSLHLKSFWDAPTIHLIKLSIHLARLPGISPLLPVVKILGSKSLRQSSAPTRTCPWQAKAYVVLLACVKLASLQPCRIEGVLLLDPTPLAVVLVVAVGRDGCQEEATGDYDADEGQAEEQEGPLAHGALER